MFEEAEFGWARGSRGCSWFGNDTWHVYGDGYVYVPPSLVGEQVIAAR